MGIRASSDSGEIILDKLPVPKGGRDSMPRMPTAPRSSRDKQKYLIGAAALGLVLVGFIARPFLMPDSQLDVLAGQVRAANQARLDAEKKIVEAEEKTRSVESAKRSVQEKLAIAEGAQSELADKAAAQGKKLAAAKAVQDKLAPALDKGVGTMTIEGDEVHLALSDKLLFKPADDVLTDKGIKILAKLATVLKTDLRDRTIWIQGHTDDTPVPQPPAPKPPKKVKGKPDVVEAPPVPRFKTNWELSSARALAIVHYFQDVAKLEPTRLAALAYSQYKPASSTVKAQNRRMVLVLAPRPKS
jgi:chemotaxis protein MotB